MNSSVAFRRPESVLVLVYTQAHEVLLMQRADAPAFWQSITGALEVDEQVMAAAQRELQEETGICVDQLGLSLVDHQRSEAFEISGVWRKRYKAEHTHNTEHLLSLKLPEKVDVQLDLNEHVAFEWLDAISAAERATSPTNQRAIRNIVV